LPCTSLASLANAMSRFLVVAVAHLAANHMLRITDVLGVAPSETGVHAKRCDVCVKGTGLGLLFTSSSGAREGMARTSSEATEELGSLFTSSVFADGGDEFFDADGNERDGDAEFCCINSGDSYDIETLKSSRVPTHPEDLEDLLMTGEFSMTIGEDEIGLELCGSEDLTKLMDDKEVSCAAKIGPFLRATLVDQRRIRTLDSGMRQQHTTMLDLSRRHECFCKFDSNNAKESMCVVEDVMNMSQRCVDKCHEVNSCIDKDDKLLNDDQMEKLCVEVRYKRRKKDVCSFAG